MWAIEIIGLFLLALGTGLKLSKVRGSPELSCISAFAFGQNCCFRIPTSAKLGFLSIRHMHPVGTCASLSGNWLAAIHVSARGLVPIDKNETMSISTLFHHYTNVADIAGGQG